MRKFMILALATTPLITASSAHAISLSDLRPQPYSSISGGGTTQTNGGTINLNRSGSRYLYGQSQTFNSGSNPRNDVTTNSGGIGLRF